MMCTIFEMVLRWLLEIGWEGLVGGSRGRQDVLVDNSRVVGEVLGHEHGSEGSSRVHGLPVEGARERNVGCHDEPDGQWSQNVYTVTPI